MSQRRDLSFQLPCNVDWHHPRHRRRGSGVSSLCSLYFVKALVADSPGRIANIASSYHHGLSGAFQGSSTTGAGPVAGSRGEARCYAICAAREESERGGGQISVLRAQAGVDIDARNSPLDFVFVRRLSKSSIASTVESGLRTLRSTQTRLSSSGGRSNSSFRVPER